MAEDKPQKQDPMRAAFIAHVNPQLQAWLIGLMESGIDRSIPMRSPLEEPGKITSGWGVRDSTAIAHAKGTPAATGNHRAVDMTTQLKAAGRQVPVHSLVGGTLLFAGEIDKGSGYSVVLGGDDGYVYTFAHLRADSVKSLTAHLAKHPRQHLDRDGVVAMMGHTGTASADIVHVVRYALPGFAAWSWKNRSGMLDDHAPGEGFRQYIHSLGKPSIGWDNLDRGVPITGWPDPSKTPQAQMAKGTKLPANTEQERYPHLYQLRDQLVEHYMQHPWPHAMGEKPNTKGIELRKATFRGLSEAMGLHPDGTQPSPRLKALDAEVYRYSQQHPESKVRGLTLEWLEPHMRTYEVAYQNYLKHKNEPHSPVAQAICNISGGLLSSFCPAQAPHRPTPETSRGPHK
ncbi:MAG: M23 family metallopeptidase [Rickettsiales bacterium]